MSQPTAPPGRKVVVVRAGPDPKRPIIRDGIIGVVGGLLLLSSVLLVNVLPDEEVVEAQYRANFGQVSFEDPNGSKLTNQLLGRPLVDGETWTLEYDVPFANVYGVELAVFLPDDRPATDPDTFRITLEAPNGTVYDYANGDIMTIAPEATGGSTPPFYQTPSAAGTRVISFNLAAPPSSYFFTATDVLGEKGDFELFEIKAALEEFHTRADSAGTWKVHVQLVSTGNCPAVDPASPDFNRATQCPVDNAFLNQNEGAPQADHSQDTGNPATISTFSISYYTVLAPTEV